MAFKADTWPGYMGWTANASALPRNLDAAAELAVGFIAELHRGSGGLLPAYFEAINEPNGDSIAFASNTTTVNAYQRAVAAKLALFLATVGERDAIMLGGPALAGLDLAHNHFRGLESLFWGNATSGLQQQQFVSFHIFDSFGPAMLGGRDAFVERTNSGGMVAAALDLIEARSIGEFGAPLPLFPTEHGLATGNTPGLYAAKGLGHLQALEISSFWGHFLGLLGRGGNVQAANAFLISNDYALKTDAAVALFNRTAGMPTNVAEATYGLLQKLDGLTSVRCVVEHTARQQRVVVEALSDLDLNTIVLLKNLGPDPAAVNLTLLACAGGDPTARFSVTRAIIDTDGLPQLQVGTVAAEDLGALRLGDRELCVVEATCSVPNSPRLRRDRHYVLDTGIAIGKTGVVNASLRLRGLAPTGASPSQSRVQSAVLRIGFAQDFASSAVGPVAVPDVAPPTLTLNGHAVAAAPTALKTDDLLPPKPSQWYGQWRAWEFRIDPAILAAGNNWIKLVFTPPSWAASGGLSGDETKPLSPGSVASISLETYSSVYRAHDT